MDCFNVFRLIFLLIMLGVAGCQSNQVNSADKSSVNSIISRGEARLTCTSSCYSDWNAVRSYALELYNSESWGALATIVARVGYESDQTYFYLGRAAEASGLFDAANIYYQLGMKTDNRCQPIGGQCNDFDIQQQLKFRMLMTSIGNGRIDQSMRCMSMAQSLDYIKTNLNSPLDLSGNQIDSTGMSVLISTAIKYKRNHTISSVDIALDASKYTTKQGSISYQHVVEIIARLGQKSTLNIWKNFSGNQEKKRAFITSDERQVPVLATDFSGDRIHLLYPNGQICTTPTARFLDKAEGRPFVEILDETGPTS